MAVVKSETVTITTTILELSEDERKLIIKLLDDVSSSNLDDSEMMRAVVIRNQLEDL